MRQTEADRMIYKLKKEKKNSSFLWQGNVKNVKNIYSLVNI